MNGITDLLRYNIGFDRFFESFEEKAGNYPPYNIEVVDDNKYIISMAVAGFKLDNIDITHHDNKLIVAGNKADDKQERKYIHKGLALRNFTQTFGIADHVEVKGANLEDGILSIYLEKEIPEEMKPKKIQISQANMLNK